MKKKRVSAAWKLNQREQEAAIKECTDAHWPGFIAQISHSNITKLEIISRAEYEHFKNSAELDDSLQCFEIKFGLDASFTGVIMRTEDGFQFDVHFNEETLRYDKDFVIDDLVSIFVLNDTKMTPLAKRMSYQSFIANCIFVLENWQRCMETHGYGMCSVLSCLEHNFQKVLGRLVKKK